MKHYVKTWTNDLTGEIEHCMAHNEYITEDLIEPIPDPSGLVVEVPGGPRLIPSYNIEEFEVDSVGEEPLRARDILDNLEVVADAVSIISSPSKSMTISNATGRRDYRAER